MTDAPVDIDNTIQDLITRRDDANSALDETLMALRRDIAYLQQENEKLFRRLRALEGTSGVAPVRLVSPASSISAARVADDR